MRGLVNATVSDDAFSDGDLGGSREREPADESQACEREWRTRSGDELNRTKG